LVNFGGVIIGDYIYQQYSGIPPFVFQAARDKQRRSWQENPPGHLKKNSEKTYPPEAGKYRILGRRTSSEVLYSGSREPFVERLVVSFCVEQPILKKTGQAYSAENAVKTEIAF